MASSGKQGAVTSQQLLDLFGTGTKNLAPTAKGYVPPSLRLAKGATPAQQQTLAKMLAAPAPAVPKANPAGYNTAVRGTHDFYGIPTNADAKTIQYINSTNRINSEAAQLDGKPAKKQGNSWWNRVVDVLSRGQYASAEATKRLDSAFNESRHEGHGVVGSFLTSLDNAAGGILPGLEGKKKTDFIDVYQRNADEQKARKEQTDKSKKLIVTDGSAKVNPWAKYGLGLLSDVALDPLTYAGVGVVPKLAKAGKYAKDVEEGVKAAKAAEISGRAAVRTAVGLHDGGDAALKAQALKTAQTELKATPHLHNILKDVKTDHGAAHLAQTAPDATYIKTHPDLLDRAKITQLMKEGGPKWASTPVNTPEKYVNHVLTHEFGHAKFNALPDALKNNIWKVLNDYSKGGGDTSHLVEHLGERAAHGSTPASVAKEAAAEAYAQYRIMGHTASNMARRVGAIIDGHYASLGDTLDNGRKGFGANEIQNALGVGTQGVKQGKKGLDSDRLRLLSKAERNNLIQRGTNTIADVAKSHGQKALEDGMTKAEAAAVERNTADHLTEAMLRNVNPETKKALQFKFAGAKLGSVQAPELASKAVEKLAKSVPGETFTKGFVAASRRLDPHLHQLNVGNKSKAASVMDAHAHNLNSVYNVPLKTRQNVWEAAAGGLHHVVIPGGKELRNGVAAPVGSLVDHFDNELKKIGQAIADEHLTAGEIRKGLPNPPTKGDDPFKLDMNAYRDKSGELDPNWLKHEVYNKWGSAVGQDPAKALYYLRAAYTKAVAHKNLHNEIVKTFGIKDTADAATKALARKGGYREVVRYSSNNVNHLPYHQGILYHPDIAKHIEALHDLTLDSKTTGKYVRHFDTAQGIFKSSVTKYSPGFYSRNMLGEVLNSYLAGVHNPDVYRKAMKVMLKHDSQYLGPASAYAGDVTRASRQVGNAVMSNPVRAAMDISKPNHSILKNVVGKSGRPRFVDVASDKISADLIHHAYQQAGLDSGFIRTEFRHGLDSTRGGRVGKTLQGIDSKATDLSAAVENYARMAHFIDALSKTPANVKTFKEAADLAATTVRKFHFDYNDFTKFEKSVLSRGIPFYKWTRKNLPLMLEMTFAKPGKAFAPYKALTAASRAQGFDPREGSAIPNAEDVIPKYIRDAGAVPFGHHGKNVVYENAALPFGQAYQMFGEGPKDFAENVGQMTTPFLKDPIELLAGQKVGGAPINSNSKYAVQSNPLTNTLYKLFGQNPNDPGNTGAPGTERGSLLTNPAFLQFLTGAGLLENTPKTIRSEAKQMQTAAAARRKDAQKKKGIKLR